MGAVAPSAAALPKPPTPLALACELLIGRSSKGSEMALVKLGAPVAGPRDELLGLDVELRPRGVLLDVGWRSFSEGISIDPASELGVSRERPPRESIVCRMSLI